MRILLVEDDEMIGNAIVQALKDAAYAADWVGLVNGSQPDTLAQGSAVGRVFRFESWLNQCVANRTFRVHR